LLRIFLPLLTYPYSTAMPGLQRCLDLAATLGSEILALVVEIDIPPIRNPPVPLGLDVVAMAAEAEALSRSRADDVSAHLRREGQRVNLRLDLERVRSRLEWVGETLALAARTHDCSLFVLGDSTEERSAAEALIFDSGRPVILIPGDGEAAAHVNTIAVAWDGGRAAARALHDSMPVLQRAERVVILTARRDKEIDPRSVEGVLALLDQRGIKNSQSDVLVTSENSIGEALQEAALRQDAGLLVMGAYGHSRIREFVLGGATRSVLKNLRLPILMSH
jgi:nucleotide-binding universal stress UspA family protein